jgi:hypothetical protein
MGADIMSFIEQIVFCFAYVATGLAMRDADIMANQTWFMVYGFFCGIIYRDIDAALKRKRSPKP